MGRWRETSPPLTWEKGCAQGPYRLEDPRADLKEQLAGAKQVQLKRRANRPASGCGGFYMGWSTLRTRGFDFQLAAPASRQTAKEESSSHDQSIENHRDPDPR